MRTTTISKGRYKITIKYRIDFYGTLLYAIAKEGVKGYRLGGIYGDNEVDIYNRDHRLHTGEPLCETIEDFKNELKEFHFSDKYQAMLEEVFPEW